MKRPLPNNISYRVSAREIAKYTHNKKISLKVTLLLSVFTKILHEMDGTRKDIFLDPGKR